MQQQGLPVFLNNSPSAMCEQILWLVKNSNLNFTVQESPFSLNISLKKRFVNRWHNNDNSGNQQVNGASQKYAQDVFNENESKAKCINDLEKQLQNLSEELADSDKNRDSIVDKKIKASNEEKRSLQIKHEKICADNKNFKQENETLHKDLNNASVALKTSRKETKDALLRSEKKVDGLENKIRELVQFKSEKESEEKNIKNQKKKIDQKLKAIKEREAQIEVEKLKFERSKVQTYETSPENPNKMDEPALSNNNHLSATNRDTEATASISNLNQSLTDSSKIDVPPNPSTFSPMLATPAKPADPWANFSELCEKIQNKM